MEPIGDREIHHRHHIVAFAGGDHTAGGIGGSGEEGDALHPLGTGENDRIYSYRRVGIGNIENRRHAGAGAFQGHEGIGAAVGGEHLHHLGFDALVVFAAVKRIEAFGNSQLL